MKNLKYYILVLLSVILIFTLLSCNLFSTDTSTDTDSEIVNTDIPPIDDGKLKISYETENLDIYTSYKLGEYFGNGFKKEITCGFEGYAQYEIMQDYEETAESTTYGADVDEALFETHYILALRFLYSPDNLGLVGIQSLSKGTTRIIANALYSANGNLDEDEYYYYYIAVPISELEEWNDEGEIEIRKNFIDYIGANCIELDYTYEDVNGYTQLLTRSQLESYISKNNIPIRMGAIGNTENYIIHISKGRFDYKPSILKPNYENGEIKITVDYSTSYHKAEKTYLSIIALNDNLISHITDVKKITVTLRSIKAGMLSIKDYAIEKTEETYNKVNLYTAFKGGVFYGLDFVNIDKSAYTVIDDINDLIEKAEFSISQDDLKDKIVIVLRLVGEKDNRIGFSGIEPTENGIKIISHISPYYEQIQNNFDDKYEIIYKEEDSETQENKIEYEYILAPKSLLSVISQKTGHLIVENDLTFNNYSFRYGDTLENVGKNNYSLDYFPKNNLSDYNIKSGDTWRIKTNLQLRDFTEKYDISWDFRYDPINQGGEYVIIYLENHPMNDIMQWSATEKDNKLTLHYLVKEMKEHTKEESNFGYFIFIEKNATENEVTTLVEYTKLEYSSCNVLPNYEDVTTYDFYEMELKYGNIPDWKFKLIADFDNLRSIFDTYGEDERKEEITADNIFDSAVFEENYVLALHLYEGHTGAIKNTFYNARMSVDKDLYLYAFQNSSAGNDVICEMLYFIIIPKTEIPSDIKDVTVQSTSEVVYNGPFEYVSLIDQYWEEHKIDGTHLIINSEPDLEAFYEDYSNYDKLQSIDFENNFLLVINRCYYRAGEFVNFKTTSNKIASITFMIDPSCDIITDGWDKYFFDFVIIPKEYLIYEIDYLYLRYEEQFIIDEEDKHLIE